MIEILTSGNVEKDIQDFLNALIQKYNIKRVDEFLEEFFDFVSQVSKEEYTDPEKIIKTSKENPEVLDRISKDFFNIIDKYSEGFDFFEGAEKELELLKKKVEEK
jgi:glutamyl-tRNA reductase